MLRINVLNSEKKIIKLRERSREKHTHVMFILSRWTVLFSVCSGGGWRVMHYGVAYDTIDWVRVCLLPNLLFFLFS